MRPHRGGGFLRLPLDRCLQGSPLNPPEGDLYL